MTAADRPSDADLDRWEELASAATDDIGIQYSTAADEWLLRCDKPTMQLLRKSSEAVPALIAEVRALRDLVDRNGVRWCLCSRADRIHDRVQLDCPHHGTPMHQQRDHAHARLAAVEALAKGWAVMAAQAMDTDTREWLAAASRSVFAVLSAALTDTTKEN